MNLPWECIQERTDGHTVIEDEIYARMNGTEKVSNVDMAILKIRQLLTSMTCTTNVLLASSATRESVHVFARL